MNSRFRKALIVNESQNLEILILKTQNLEIMYHDDSKILER